METRFNSSELIRQKDDSHLQTIVGRPGAAGFGHVSVHRIGRDQEGFTQFYQKLILPNSTAGKRENPHDNAS
jgi:hypothetical protein